MNEKEPENNCTKIKYHKVYNGGVEPVINERSEVLLSLQIVSLSGITRPPPPELNNSNDDASGFRHQFYISTFAITFLTCLTASGFINMFQRFYVFADSMKILSDITFTLQFSSVLLSTE